MAPVGKKSDNFRILEEIYHDGENKKQPLSRNFPEIRTYFSDPKKVDKFLAGAILFLGFGSFFFGFWQFKYKINDYFQIKTDSGANAIALNQQASQDQDLLGLKTKDTDLDGLSDYDELNLYFTSPYLPDTDSDGIRDDQEIARGTDPNCPQGTDCYAPTVSDLVQDVSPDQAEEIDIRAEAIKQTAPAENPLLSGDLTIEQIRQLLLQAGMNQADLAKYSDQELLAAYYEALAQDQTRTGQSSTAQVQNNSQLNLEDMTPEEIKNLLRQSGVSETILNAVSDEELMQLVAESIPENQ
ncbi:MAG: thrombospondin type 3 repeat-containing protein [Patescibacteria group bacterium]|jgi:hypothetical protein|nr:thrombospondin type 3 repeat-containing protein [Patescibacteria group bacterium]